MVAVNFEYLFVVPDETRPMADAYIHGFAVLEEPVDHCFIGEVQGACSLVEHQNLIGMFDCG